MVKRKDRQYNGQNEGQIIQWSKGRTDNTMVKKRKDREHNGQTEKGQRTQWPKRGRTENTMAKRSREKNKYLSTKEENKTK